MKLHAIIRPIEFTQAGLIDRGYHWVAEWLGLFATLIYLITFGYYEPCWKFSFLTYILSKTQIKQYGSQDGEGPWIDEST